MSVLDNADRFDGTPAPRSRFAPIAFDDIQLTGGRQYLIKGLLPRTGLAVVWGPPKCGKSFWTFDAVMHVALCREYRGRRVVGGPVVYVAAEGQIGFRARVEAFRRSRLDLFTGAAPPFYLIPDRPDLVGERDAIREQIEVALKPAEPVAIVLDTLNRTMRGSESSDEDMTAYVNAADELRAAFECVVIIVHHCGHEATRPRGHTSLGGAVDAQLAVKRDTYGTITTTLEFMKDGPEGVQVFSRLESVEVGTDDDGDPVTSCVVSPVEAAAGPARKPLSSHAKVALDALVKVVDAAQIAEPPDAIKLRQRGHSAHVPLPVWRAEFYARQVDQGDTKGDTLKKRFKRAAETLQSVGKAGFRDGAAWLCIDKGTEGT